AGVSFGSVGFCARSGVASSRRATSVRAKFMAPQSSMSAPRRSTCACGASPIKTDRMNQPFNDLWVLSCDRWSTPRLPPPSPDLALLLIHHRRVVAAVECLLELREVRDDAVDAVFRRGVRVGDCVRAQVLGARVAAGPLC